MVSIIKNLVQAVVVSFHKSMPKAFKTSLWLLKIMIPVTFLILILDYSGLLTIMAGWIAPLFVWMGLPGESAFVLLTSIFANIYSAIAVITTVGFTLREATILAVMCLIAHGFIIESAVVRKTGSNVVWIIFLRIAASIFAGIILNLMLPELSGHVGNMSRSAALPFSDALINWGIATFWLCLKIVLLIAGLMFLQRLLDELGVIAALKKPLRPFMGLMGLPQSATFSWVVGNVLGLAYGSAIIIDEVNEGTMTRDEADLLNHHLVVSHSQLEDPLLFAAIGIPIAWMIWPRVLLAILVVWLRKGYNMVMRK